ncbi:hypothetical protein KFZ56_04460 [Virgibacillus sp. NKC19-3]|uniref:hypothetical protein n=1 Tax=Virgibacillus saliphilus TaxID=2831674 RepID=UPI001C9B8A12|nr:hypothetical protein [Virgibacillus sp. NKC19-3]MBY7142358.1 hypothetical protein [Virgibacillus sp. NKC19-3]
MKEAYYPYASFVTNFLLKKEAFRSGVDVSETAVIRSNYLQDVQEDVNELYEDLTSFTSKGVETDIGATMGQIETAMKNAQISEGQARFADCEGAPPSNELVNL